MTKSEHRVSVDNGKYTFVCPADHPTVRVIDRIEPGETWVYYVDKALAVAAMMRELDAARAVVQAVRRLVGPMSPADVGRMISQSGEPECQACGDEWTKHGDLCSGSANAYEDTIRRITDALALHDRLVSDREPPSARCGEEQPAANTSADFDRAMFRAFMAMPSAETLADLDSLRSEIDDARLGQADRAEVKRVYEQRKAWLSSSKPCATCGKPGHRPMDHAGWDPNRVY